MRSNCWTRARLLLAATLFVAGPGLTNSRAFVAPEPNLQSVDTLAGAAPVEAGDAAAIAAALQVSPAWIEWSQSHPGWRVSWNVHTRTPHRMYGSGVRLAGPITATTIEGACREFLASTASLTGVRSSELRLARAEQRLGRWYVVFEQTVNGLPVRGARVDLRIGAGGEVVLLGSDFHRDAQAPGAALLGPDEALAAAARDLRSAAGDPRHELVVLPLPRGDGFVYRLAYELRFRTSDPLGVWLARVDARDGTLLQRENQIRYAELTGQISAQVEPTTVDDPYVQVPLRETKFDVGLGTTEFGYTDAAGNFVVTTTATDSVNVRTRLAGRYARVYNHQLGFATPTRTARMLPGSARDFVWDDSNSRASERDAYYFVLFSHQAMRDLDPGFTGLDYQMPVTVDIFDRDCNAYWDGVGVNFFGESGRCANTARIADVVLHEYGHGVTERVYSPFSPTGAMHEAFSDYFAATLTDQPVIGRGFRGPGTSIRNVDNTNRWPDDVVNEVHLDGLILGGALWDLREAVGRSLADTLFHYARYGSSESFDDYMLDVLVTDDDNADIYDGTPHFDAIIGAFMPHGIGDYSVQVTHVPQPDTEDLAKTLRFEATILSVFALDPASLLVHWAADGGAWSTLALAPAGPGSRDYAADLPQQPDGTTITYYITAADTAGNQAALPPSGPAAPYSFRVGTDTTPPTVAHVPLGDRPLDSPGWSVQAEIHDNLDREIAGALVEWSRNSVTLDQRLDLDPAPAPRWRASLPTSGASLGDSIFYRIVATDSATSPNVAYRPATGHHAFRVVHGFVRDLELDDAGFLGDGDWEWGVPFAGPQAYSGASVWGTGVGGTYSNDQESLLDLGSVDLSTWTRAGLVFRSWFASEPVYDGGNVQVSTDGGTSWELLVPNGGYPVDNVLALAEPGWSGSFPPWERVEFDLSRFLGQQVALRLRFASDLGLVDLGWFVDDVEVVERQVLSLPLALRAQSGLDSQVLLRWDPPAGIDPLQAGTPLAGYHVYRATAPDLSDIVRLTASPLTEPAYTDLGVVNGTVYSYYVTAVYAEGESAPSQVATGQPYVSVYASDAVALYVPVPLGVAADTTIGFTNTGTGFLEMNVFLGDATDAGLDDVRIAYELGSTGSTIARSSGDGASSTPRRAAGADAPELEVTHPVVGALLASERKAGSKSELLTWGGEPPSIDAGWQLLHTDTSEPTSPDLAQLWVSEAGGQITFRVTGWQAWGNPLADFNLVLGFDVDANRATGDGGGEDIYVLLGPFALAQLGVPAIIVTSDQQLLGVAGYVHVPQGADSLEIGFPSTVLGEGGQRLYTSVTALSPDMQGYRDGMPNMRFVMAWMQPRALHLSVPAGSSSGLGFDFPGLVPPGRYQGRIFLETNAPATPAVVIPVTYDFAVTDVEIEELTAQQEGDAVVLRWRTGRETDVVAFRVHRAPEGGAFAPLSPDLVPDPSRTYVFRDPDPGPGRWLYRVAEVDATGRVTLHAGVSVTVDGTAPRAAFLDPAVPNPFNPTTTLRFGVAVGGPADLVVYDARGREVRVLWRVVAAEPGSYRVAWDGRDARGQRVASGVYHARLRTAGNALTRRLTLLK